MICNSSSRVHIPICRYRPTHNKNIKINPFLFQKVEVKASKHLCLSKVKEMSGPLPAGSAHCEGHSFPFCYSLLEMLTHTHSQVCLLTGLTISDLIVLTIRITYHSAEETARWCSCTGLSFCSQHPYVGSQLVVGPVQGI